VLFQEEYDRFFSLNNGAKKQTQTVSLFAIGNHDYWNRLSEEEALKRLTVVLSTFFYLIKGAIR
jgi:hypothetical protein